MIQKLKIQNFQSHKDTTLDFHPGVNVIVGASDSGKTAVIRALRWLIWNRPGGDDFRSDWGGDTEVTIQTNEDVDAGVSGWEISRSKGKENIYKIGPKELKAFGTSVPEEIQKVLNIDDTNLQKQFDSPFLISSSPGEVAGYFNQIAHLERIDSSISYVNSRILKLTSKQKADTEVRKEYEEELKQYKYIDKFEIDLEELEHQQSTHIQQILSRAHLGRHLALMLHNIEEIEKQEKITELAEPVDDILQLYEEKKAEIKDMIELEEIIFAIKDNTTQSNQQTKKVALLPQVDALLKLHKEWEDLRAERRALRLSLRDITNISKQQTEYEVLIEEKEKLFHENMPDECPLCGEIKTK